jgi:hypothetical protein
LQGPQHPRANPESNSEEGSGHYVIAVLLLRLWSWSTGTTAVRLSGNIDPWFYLSSFDLVNFKRDLFPDFNEARLSTSSASYLLPPISIPVAASFALHLGLGFALLSLFNHSAMDCRRARRFPDGNRVYRQSRRAARRWLGLYGRLRNGLQPADHGSLDLCGPSSPAPRFLLLAGVGAMLVYANLFWTRSCRCCGVLRRAGVDPRAPALWRLLLRTGWWCAPVPAPDRGLLCHQPPTHGRNLWFLAPWRMVNRPRASIAGEPGPLLDWAMVMDSGGAIGCASIVPAPFAKSQRACNPLPFFLDSTPAGVAGFTYLQFGRGMPVLGTSYYASTLLPFAFLVIRLRSGLRWKMASGLFSWCAVSRLF